MRPQCLLLTTVAGSLAQSLHGGMKGVSLLLIEEFQRRDGSCLMTNQKVMCDSSNDTGCMHGPNATSSMEKT
jgi:hypothetical protein